jgi:hypothetical protein
MHWPWFLKGPGAVVKFCHSLFLQSSLVKAYNSALAKARGAEFPKPPATTTLPFCSRSSPVHDFENGRDFYHLPRWCGGMSTRGAQTQIHHGESLDLPALSGEAQKITVKTRIHRFRPYVSFHQLRTSSPLALSGYERL